MTIQAIIFDCDGTLADTMPLHFAAWTEISAQFNVELSEQNFYAWGGQPTRMVAERLVKQSGSSSSVEDIALAKEQAFERMIHDVEPIEPIATIVRENFGRIPLAVASGAVRRICVKILEHINLLDCFNTIVTSEDVAAQKPDPEIFLQAADRLRVDRRHCLVYEDADLGIEAARNAGMQWIDIRQLLADNGKA